jgi:hypothetical protein
VLLQPLTEGIAVQRERAFVRRLLQLHQADRDVNTSLTAGHAAGVSSIQYLCEYLFPLDSTIFHVLTTPYTEDLEGLAWPGATHWV